MMPFFVGGLAVVLVAVGVIILVVWFTGPNRPALALFASPTPTNTATFTPTPTVPSPTPTLTPTVTLTPTLTVTPTPSGPFEYTVVEKDTCWDIAAKYKVDVMVLLALNNFAPNTCPIAAGQKILIPSPDQTLPTATPLPTGLAKGTKIEYIVQLGDSIGAIVAKFNTTVEAIQAIKENNLTDPNKLVAGQKLIIPVNINTPVPTKPVKATATATATATKAP
ncbi:MAG TPA: LysM peptidoglycan-binding domain-containing protein [Anaerolineales bacterium]